MALDDRYLLRAAWLAVVGAWLAGGCSPVPPNTVPVSGRITLSGQPLAGATVTFQPARGGNTSANVVGSVGRTNAEGRYELRLVEPDVSGAVIGQHIVTITTATLASGDDAARPTGERVPVRWRDGSQSFQVPVGGTQQADFEID